MAYTSGSDTEVQSCSKNCVKTYEKLQKQFDKQRQTLSKANLKIVAYQLGLESVEAQLVIHQKNKAVYEEKIAILEFEVKDKGNAVTRLTNQLEQTLKEKEDLKAKLEQFETSSKNLTKLINSQISSKDKTGLGYGDQLNKNDSSGSELFNSVFDSRSSNGGDNQTNDRFKKDNRYHVVPPPLTRNYMPLLADLSFARLDDSVYRPTANKTSASVSQVETSITPPSNTSVEMPRVESVRPSGVIIEDWVSDDDEDIFQSNDLQATVKPSFKKIEFTKARNEPVKSDKQAVKPRMVTQSPKVDRKDWNGKMTQKLGLGFGSTKKACFVCGSYSHLIKDCDFHEKRMAKKSVLGKGTGHREVRPIWNNTQRINHQNKFVPTAVLTRSGRIPVSTAKQVSKEKVNTIRVNGVNTAGQTIVSTIKGNGVTVVKASAGCGNPQQALKYKGIFDSGCSRHMTGNKALLTDYQDIDGGFVTFGGSTRGGKITEMDEFYGQKGIKREYSVARTPQQYGVAERKNKTLIEAVRTMLADSLLPIVFWAEEVNTAYYVLNRVLVTKPYNKIPYELIIGRAPSISFMRPFGCLITILNTLDPLGKFDGKAEEGFLVGYSVNSKAFKVFNTETRKVKENLHVNFLENKPNVAGQTEEENVSTQQYIVFLLWSSISSSYKSSDDKAKDDIVDDDACKKTIQEPVSKYDQALKNVLDKMMDQEKEATEQSDTVRKEFEAQCDSQEKITRASSTNRFNTVSTLVNIASASRTFSPVGPSSGPSFVPFGGSFPIDVVNLPHDPLMPELEDTAIIGDPKSAVQTSGMTKKNSGEHSMISYIQKQRRTNHKDFQNYLFACFLSQHEPTKISQPLDDESWVKAMQDELLQFKIQKVWTLVDLPSGKKAIGTKWVYRNKKDERGVVIDVKSAFLYGTIEEE
ncbi:putative ribonuclease H-like domain-containing protein, partial [Tanacetum coccineum]